MIGSYAYYRLPDQDSFTVISSCTQVKTGMKLDEIGTESGFVIAPFDIQGKHPVVFIPAESVSTRPVPQKCALAGAHDTGSDSLVPDGRYIHDFNAFHDAVISGRFSKLVLSRSKVAMTPAEIHPEDMFMNACLEYPHLCVMLYHTPVTGTWLTATPEPLLEYSDGIYHTVALAGTMRDGDGCWSSKNRSEQQYVERFIKDCISESTDSIRTEGPYTSHAGDLIHLKTDLSFSSSQDNLGHILARLHPTPAVCGLPQADALRFIMDNESHDRKYYSGFAGPVAIDGESHLYVSLRCAFIHPDGKEATLFAGGGIMPESTCTSEYEETENKMQTIARCIATKTI